MKTKYLKLIVLFILTTLLTIELTSCESKEYTLTYVVYYPGSSDTITVHNRSGYNYYSIHGTNKIIDLSNNNRIYENSAPFKILKYSSRIIKSK